MIINLPGLFGNFPTISTIGQWLKLSEKVSMACTHRDSLADLDHPIAAKSVEVSRGWRPELAHGLTNYGPADSKFHVKEAAKDSDAPLPAVLSWDEDPEAARGLRRPARTMRRSRI